MALTGDGATSHCSHQILPPNTLKPQNLSNVGHMNRKMYDAILWSHNRQQLQQYLPDGEFFPPPTCGHNSRELQLWICKVAEGSWDGPRASWCTKNYSNQITPFGRQITPFRRPITPFHFLHFFRFVFLKPWTNPKHIQLYSVRSLPPFPSHKFKWWKQNASIPQEPEGIWNFWHNSPLPQALLPGKCSKV